MYYYGKIKGVEQLCKFHIKSVLLLVYSCSKHNFIPLTGFNQVKFNFMGVFNEIYEQFYDLSNLTFHNIALLSHIELEIPETNL